MLSAATGELRRRCSGCREAWGQGKGMHGMWIEGFLQLKREEIEVPAVPSVLSANFLDPSRAAS